MAECFLFNASNPKSIIITTINGTTQPSSGREGQIWINTTESIKKAVISYDRPTKDISVGTVWIRSEYYVGTEVDIGTNNSIITKLSLCMLYDGTNWNIAEGYIYLNGSWQKFSNKAIYLEGVYNTVYMTNKSANNSTVTYQDSYYTVSTKGRTSAEAYVQFGPIPLDGIKSITMRMKDQSLQYGVIGAIIITNTSGQKRSKAIASVEQNVTDKNGDYHVIELDVSSLTGQYYINVGANTGGETISKDRVANIYEVGLK